MLEITEKVRMKKYNSKSYFKKDNFFKIFLLCLFFSILFHFLFFKNLTTFELSSFNPSYFDKIVPRRVQLKRIEIDPKLLEEKTGASSLLAPIEINEVAVAENENSSYQPSIVKDSKPKELKVEEFSEENINCSLENQLISKAKTDLKQPLIELDQSENKSKNFLKEITDKEPTSLGNYSQLEQLLEQKSPLTSETAPILLPTDLLFEYNVDQLKADAEKSLEKLAILIQRNPKAKFSIEGFSDSFGSEKYNLDLSRRRAESIKKWLLSHQDIDESKIETKGFGKTHFLVSSSGTIEQQRFNRRVEIVIHQ
jgi:outer membrane protein OmpA-like peptidoglycan-associated protein